MPELPEVETIVRGLRCCVLGRTIDAVDVRLPRTAEPSADILCSLLPGRTIVACHRRAKYIVFTLDNRSLLRVHLRMTGRMMYEGAEAMKNPLKDHVPRYTRISLTFRDGAALHFADARTFGRMTLVGENELWDANLGVEPLEANFTIKTLGGLLAGRRGAIKTVLLDQRYIAGIGNIYACEALWKSKIAPHLSAAELSKAQIKRLHSAITEILTLAVEMRGTSSRDYVDAEGLKGGFQNVLTVYGKHGSPCARCKAPIVRTVVAQRGTWWCPKCQT